MDTGAPLCCLVGLSTATAELICCGSLGPVCPAPDAETPGNAEKLATGQRLHAVLVELVRKASPLLSPLLEVRPVGQGRGGGEEVMMMMVYCEHEHRAPTEPFMQPN